LNNDVRALSGKELGLEDVYPKISKEGNTERSSRVSSFGSISDSEASPVFKYNRLKAECVRGVVGSGHPSISLES
jgi:hypothetical protein